MGEAYRVLLVARLSRKKSGTARAEGVSIEIQDERARTWAEAEGHAVIDMAADIKSGTSAPWTRKNLKPWMTDPRKLAMYDAIVFYHVDRLSRGTDEDRHYIEHWARENGKKLIMADGPQYPARGGAMEYSDKYQWQGLLDAARKEWERIQARSADTRTQLAAKGVAIGRPPFGYLVAGDKYAKRFELHPVTGPLATEAFRRVADGRTPASVAAWLSEATGESWRPNRVIEMVKRRSYLGERDGHKFPLLCGDMPGLFESANAALAARYVPHAGGRAIVHGYSSVVFCECGGVRFHKKGGAGRKPTYICSIGRRNYPGESVCGSKPVGFEFGNAEVDRVMSASLYPDAVLITTGGEAAKRLVLDDIRKRQRAAMEAGDMDKLTALIEDYRAAEAHETDPVKTEPRLTGKSVGSVWRKSTLDERRSLLSSDEFRVTLTTEGAELAYGDDDGPAYVSDGNGGLLAEYDEDEAA